MQACSNTREPRDASIAQFRENLSRLDDEWGKKQLFALNLCNAPIRRNDVIDLYE
jgi:hypothetical protein